MRILISGFEPFGGHRSNPSQQLVEDLPKCEGLELIGVVLPVTYEEAPRRLLEEIRRHRPAAVMMLGLGANHPCLRLERVAANLDNGTIADNRGVLRRGLAIDPMGPARLPSTLPLESIKAALDEAGLPVAWSDDAGSFVCNHLFYKVARALTMPCGFIHLPALQPGGPTLGQIKQGLALACKAIAQGRTRQLAWPSCRNVRDLGGLPTACGRGTRPGVFIRADNLEQLEAHGWVTLERYGVRSVVDLRNRQERGRPHLLPTHHVELDDLEDISFWQDLKAVDIDDSSPLYYAPYLERKQARCAEALEALLACDPGAVVFHCGIGRDRTGLLAALVLALVGVPPEEIAADYQLSHANLVDYWKGLGVSDQAPIMEARLAERGTSATRLLIELTTDESLLAPYQPWAERLKTRLLV